MIFFVQTVSFSPRPFPPLSISPAGSVADYVTPRFFFGNLEVLGIHIFETYGKDGHRTFLKIRFAFVENLEYGFNIFQKTWNGHF